MFNSALGVASGTLATMRFLGQTLSIAVLGAVATSRLGAAGQAVLLTGRVGSAHVVTAYVAGYHVAMAAGAAVSFVGAVASLTRPALQRPLTST